MTDFLTRLAQRTLGLASVVQPRIASLYASAAEVITASDDAFSTLPNMRASSEPATAPEPFVTAPTSSASLNVYVDQTLRSAAPGASLTPVEKTLPSPSPLIVPLSNPEKTLPLITPETIDQSTLHSSLRMENSPVVIPTKLSPTSCLETRQNHSEPLPPLARLPSIANSSENSLESQVAPPTGERFKPQQLNPSSDFSESRSSFAPPPLNQPELKPQASAVRLPLVPPAMPPASSLPLVDIQTGDLEAPSVRIPPGFASTQTPPVRSSAAITQPLNQPEPMIEIRIGRIEVRSIQPAATTQPRPKSPPSTPALSLSDYLNQREGGKP